MTCKVFISYKSEDYETASRVRSVLEQNGLHCWMAPESIPGGSSYAKEIPKAIRECDVLVAVLSRKTMSSIWVPKELDQAINQGKRVMPLMLENFQLVEDFDFYLTAVQQYQGYKNMDAELQNIIHDIRNEPSGRPVKPKPPRKKIILWGILIILMLSAVLGIYKYFSRSGTMTESFIALPNPSEITLGTGEPNNEGSHVISSPVVPLSSLSDEQSAVPAVPIPIAEGE